MTPPSGLNDSTYIILALITSLSGIIVAVVGTLLNHSNMKKLSISNVEDLSEAMEKTETMKGIEKKFDNDFRRIEHAEKCDADIKRDLDEAKAEHEEINRMLAEIRESQRRQEESQKRTEIRQEIMAPTTSRAMHEHQLDLEGEYRSIHGNGAGRIRLDMLKEDWRRRASDPDQEHAWDYKEN